MKKNQVLKKNVYVAQDQEEEPGFQPRSPAPNHLSHLRNVGQALTYLRDTSKLECKSRVSVQIDYS